MVYAEADRPSEHATVYHAVKHSRQMARQWTNRLMGNCREVLTQTDLQTQTIQRHAFH